MRWRDCDDRDGFQCATLTVPVDYADPQGDTIDLTGSVQDLIDGLTDHLADASMMRGG